MPKAACQRQDDVFLRINGVNILSKGIRYHSSSRSAYVNKRNTTCATKIHLDAGSGDAVSDNGWGVVLDQLIQEVDGPLKEWR